MNTSRTSSTLLASLLMAVLAGCGDDDPAGPGDGTFIIEARSAASFGGAQFVAGQDRVDPSSFVVGFYSVYLAPAPDCSSPVLVSDKGVTPATYDLLTDPTIFTADGATPGTYNCVVMRISDVLSFVPTTASGPCVAGTSYQTDVYRVGESDWLDVDGSALTGRGTDAAPVDDSPDVFFSTNPAAVLARGFSPNQVLLLRNPAVVPGTSTFVYDLAGSVANEGGSCRAIPGAYEFR